MSSNGEEGSGEKTRSDKERALYPHVKKYFIEELGCLKEFTGFESKGDYSLSLNLFGSFIQPDVWGLKRGDGRTIVMIGEGKADFKSSNFDICKGQGISRKRFADMVYLFFPEEGWKNLEGNDKEEILEECRAFGFGLLLVNKDGKCEEKTGKGLGEPPLASHIKFDSNRNMEVRLKGVLGKSKRIDKVIIQLIYELTMEKERVKYRKITDLIGITDEGVRGTYYEITKKVIDRELNDKGLRPVCQELWTNGYLELYDENGVPVSKKDKRKNVKEKLNDSFSLTEKGLEYVPAKTPSQKPVAILLDNEKS